MKLKTVSFVLALWLAVAADYATALSVVRGPYLQTATPTSIVVRWRTDVATDSRVRFDTSPSSLDQWADNPAVSTEHEVNLTGLTAETRYFYSVGSTASALSGGDASTYFKTGPMAGTARPTRIWVIGDAGTGSSSQIAVYNAYRNVTGSTHTDLWLQLGDNAYSDGTDAEYQTKMFNVYGTMLKQSPTWPTLGNHDGHSADSATQTGPYFNIFTLPKNGEAGGVASGTEAYYSYDYGNIHFVVLDSYETSRSTTGAMMNWIKADLGATSADWVIAYWHHPPYSKGSHNSDTESGLIDMRQNFVPVLEQYGVDLVLSGHSHSYERSKFIDGHYGLSGSFSDAIHVVQVGSGRIDGTGAYGKPSGGLPNAGAVYAVAGSSGQTSGGSLNHPAMYVSLNQLGSMVLDVNGLILNAKFLDSNGAVRDYFTIAKDTQLASCTLPWGGSIAHGQSVTAYQTNSSANCAAVSETRTCNDGTLSGSYTYASCSAPPTNVTIDLQDGLNGYAGTTDSYVSSGKGNNNYGTATGFLADGFDGSNGRLVGLVRWTTSGRIPSSAVVDSAKLSLALYNGSTGTYNVYASTGSWTESSVTWNNFSPTTKLGNLVGAIASGGTGVRTVTLNANGKALVQGWINGSAANNGLIIIDTGTNNGIDIRSSEYGTVSARPKLTVTYR